MLDIYLQFDGSDVVGESKDAGHKKWIELKAFAHQILQPKSSSASNAGGFTSERTEHGEMYFTKEIDKATVKILRACSAGSVFKKVTASFNRAYGGASTANAGQANRIEYFNIVLDNVVISSVSMSIDGRTELPHETIGLKYSKVVWTYEEQGVGGSKAGKTVASYNLATSEAG